MKIFQDAHTPSHLWIHIAVYLLSSFPLDIQCFCGKTQQASTLCKEPEETEESREQQRWSSPRKTTPRGCAVPKSSPENLHLSNITQTEQVLPRNRYVLYIHTCVHTHSITRKKEDMHLMERRERYIGKFRGRKGKGKTLKINYNPQITKLKIGIKQFITHCL